MKFGSEPVLDLIKRERERSRERERERENITDCQSIRETVCFKENFSRIIALFMSGQTSKINMLFQNFYPVDQFFILNQVDTIFRKCL